CDRSCSRCGPRTTTCASNARSRARGWRRGSATRSASPRWSRRRRSSPTDQRPSAATRSVPRCVRAGHRSSPRTWTRPRTGWAERGLGGADGGAEPARDRGARAVALELRGEHVEQQVDRGEDAPVDEAVAHVIPVAACDNDALLAQDCELPGGERLARADRPGELAHRPRAVAQLDDEQEAVPVAQRLAELGV